jgi:hypothetical protein
LEKLNLDNMKCIQAIKETKSYKLGEIRRTDDIDADQKVASGVWKFIPKSEWKGVKKTQSVVVQHDMGGSYEVKTEKKKNSKKVSK